MEAVHDAGSRDIGIAATFTLSSALLAATRFWMSELGIPGELRVAGYNQVTRPPPCFPAILQFRRSVRGRVSRKSFPPLCACGTWPDCSKAEDAYIGSARFQVFQELAAPSVLPSRSNTISLAGFLDFVTDAP